MDKVLLCCRQDIALFADGPQQLDGKSVIEFLAQIVDIDRHDSAVRAVRRDKPFDFLAGDCIACVRGEEF